MEDHFEKVAVKVSIVSMVWNLLLSLMKLAAGIAAHSGAMISDAVHSASDVFSTIVVIIGVKAAGKGSDKEHPFGHERLECVAAILLSTVLAMTGLGIGYAALAKMIRREYMTVIPGALALAAAVISIGAKEGMFWYTRHYAKKIDSGALMADAWHHRSDALSSVGALVGIGGAMLGFPIMEPVASLAICIFIEKAAYDIFKDAVDKMVDKSCDDQTEGALRECALSISGVERIDVLRTRIFGNKMYVEMEIAADRNLTLGESHAIAERVHDAIEQRWPKIKHILIHVNPV